MYIHKTYIKQWQQEAKAHCILHYGGKCTCCGEDRLVFLAIDHINGGGSKEHQKVGHGTAFYRWLRKNEYPQGYQVLCHNCNFAKWMGICPHKLGNNDNG